MTIFLFVLAFIWFAFIAPLKVTIAAVASIVLITVVVQATAKAVVGGTTFYEAFKAVGLSAALLVLGLFALLSFVKRTGISHFDGVGALALLACFFLCYSFGFKFGLQASMRASALVALVSTAISAALFFGLRNFLA